MAISMADHFKLQKRAQNFERDSFLTLKEMREFNTNYLPDIFTATCLETGKFYIFNISNEVDETLGRWRELSVDISTWIDSSETTDDDGNTIITTTIGGITTVVKKDPDGTILEESGTVGGVTTTTNTNPDGTKISKVGEKIVEGTKKETTSSTNIDDDGNTITIVEIIEKTPNGTKKTITKEVNKIDGSKEIITEIIIGGSDGVEVGSATGNREKKIYDSDGNLIKTETKEITYINGEEEQWATEEDIDELYNTLLGGLGWNI